jgi:hypothetical protein
VSTAKRVIELVYLWALWEDQNTAGAQASGEWPAGPLNL